MGMKHLTPLICPEGLRDWAGIDEAGRGCLAGPVAAAAVILPKGATLPGLADSKKLSPTKREDLALIIKSEAAAWGLGLCWPEEIDRINILQATFTAMSRAVLAMLGRYPGVLPPGLLIDGPHTIPGRVLAASAKGVGLPLLEQTAVVKGDDRIPAIAAASIIAKTHRDRLMAALGRRFPGYGLEEHKGYATKAHYAALEALGPCATHRLTFAGVLPAPRGEPSPKQYSLLTAERDAV